jgi:PAS domain-containing protein
MIPNLLQILWFTLPLCGIAAGLAAWPQAGAPTRWVFTLFFTLGMLSWGYLSIRIIGFRLRLFTFLRHLINGDYESGIRSRRRFPDEVSRLEALANRLAERLQIYDRLRANRVSIQARAFELLLDQTPEPVAAIDLQQENFLFNPAAQKVLGIERQSFSLESVLKPDINAEFRDLFNDAIAGRKVRTEGFSWLQVPGMSDPVYIGLQFAPLRDRDEEVRFALLTLKVPHAHGKKTT